jgi:hypothetical protein
MHSIDRNQLAAVSGGTTYLERAEQLQLSKLDAAAQQIERDKGQMSPVEYRAAWLGQVRALHGVLEIIRWRSA